MKQSTAIWTICAVNLAVMLVVAYLLWNHFKPPVPPAGEHIPATVAPQVKKVAKVSIKPPLVRVYGLDAKARLGIKQTNATAHVLQATVCPSNLRPQTVVTLINEETGETETTIRRDKLPWFGFNPSGYAGLGYGIKPGTGATVRLMAGADFLQVKAWHLGVDGTLDSDGAAYIGGHGVWRW